MKVKVAYLYLTLRAKLSLHRAILLSDVACWHQPIGGPVGRPAGSPPPPPNAGGGKEEEEEEVQVVVAKVNSSFTFTVPSAKVKLHARFTSVPGSDILLQILPLAPLE